MGGGKWGVARCETQQGSRDRKERAGSGQGHIIDMMMAARMMMMTRTRTTMMRRTVMTMTMMMMTMGVLSSTWEVSCHTLRRPFPKLLEAHPPHLVQICRGHRRHPPPHPH